MTDGLFATKNCNCKPCSIWDIFTSKLLATVYKNSLIVFLSGNFKHSDILKRHLYLEGSFCRNKTYR